MTAERAWTIERVKEELPDVTVQVESGNTVTGWVRGRMLEDATVYLPTSDGRNFRFAWKTIADALNNQRPLRLGSKHP